MAFGCTITVAADKTPSAQTDFPWVAVTANFPTASKDGGTNSLPNGGGSLKAYTDNTKSVQLALHVVTFVTGGSPDIQIWGNSPSLNVASTVYLEDDSVQTSQPAASSTYGSDNAYTDSVRYHHEENPAGSAPQMIDSTGNGNDATTTGMVAGDLGSGQIGDALTFDGASYTKKADNATLDIGTNDFYVLAWIYFDSSAGSGHSARIINTSGNGTPSNKSGFQFKIQRDGANATWGFRDCSVSDGTGGIGSGEDSTTTSHAMDAWHRVAMVYDRTAKHIKAYINGSLDYTFIDRHTVSTSELGSLSSANDLCIGASIYTNNVASTPSQHFIGELDEVVFGLGTVTADYIETDYNIQSDPSTFWTTSAWEEQDATTVNDTTANINVTALNDAMVYIVADTTSNINITPINDTVIIAVSVNDTLQNINITPINDTVIIIGLGWTDRQDPTNVWANSTNPTNNWIDRT